MARIPKKVICLATVAVIICAHVPVAHAEAVPSVLYGSSTVADIVMSYYAMGGAAVANTDWINTLYDSLGSNLGTIQSFAENGYLVTNPDGTWYATQALEQAIENAPAYQSLGLDQIFNVSAQEAAAGGGLAASTGAATLAGATGAVGSVGVVPLLGGVTAAYWGGIALGTLVNHLVSEYKKYIASGAIITANKNALNAVPDGGSLATENVMWGGVPAQQSFVMPPGVVSLGYYEDSTYYRGFVFNITNEDSYYLLFNPRYPNGQRNPLYHTSNAPTNVAYTYISYGFSNFTMFANEADYRAYYTGLKNGTIQPPKVKSPDLIGPDGNQEAEEDENGQYQVPYMLPQVDPSVQSGKPLTMEDWLRFANGAKSNNSDPDGKTKNKKLFDDILDEIKQGVPSTPDNPDPDPDPYHPPTPTPVPDPDYGDPNPDQPEFESETDISDPVDTGNPWVTPDLLDKFPFCIPKDMIDMVKGFKSVDRTAPHISWNFKSPVGHVDYTFNLDLEDFEDVATLLRALELAVFIVGLAFATRYLIGAS